MSINNEIKNLNLKEGEKITLTIKWPTNSKQNVHALLDGARIVIRDEKNLALDINGYLSEGQCTFTVPRNDYTFKVEVFAEYNELVDGKYIPRLSAISDAIDYDKTTNRRIPWSWSSDIPNETTLYIKEKEQKHIGIWSTFQAGIDLFKTTQKEEYLGYTPNKFLEIQSSSGITATAIGEKAITINIHDGSIDKDDRFKWHVIAHEFAHFIAHDAQAVVGSPGGDHIMEYNQYDYTGNNDENNEGKGTYHNKDLSMKLAFAEGFATWLGKSLLNGSKYIQKKYALPEGSEIKDTDIGGSMYETYDLGVNKGDYFDKYGEDAELAIARLLWNITNKENGVFERIESKETIANKVKIPLKTLFDNVLTGKKLKNISDFYQRLYLFHIEIQDSGYFERKLFENDYYWKDTFKIEKINELGNLFAEFGIAPTIDYDQKKNTVSWSQNKTGSFPEYDKFNIYIFREDTGKLWLRYTNLMIKAKEDHGRYIYEYKLDMHTAPEEKMRVLVMTRSTKDVDNNINEEITPYFSASADLKLQSEWIQSVVIIGYLPKDSTLLWPSPEDAFYLQIPYTSLGPGGGYVVRVDSSGTIRGYYSGWSAHEGKVPKFAVRVFMPGVGDMSVVYGNTNLQDFE